MIKMVLATDEKGGIGLDGKLPWHIPEDLKYFKEITEGQTVVMGRKTFESLPFEHGLPNRLNWIISNNRNSAGIGNIVTDLATWAANLEYLNRVRGDIYIIGGASVYEQLFPYVEEIHHSCMKGLYECDTFVDTSLWVDSSDWKLCETKVLCDSATVNIWRKV